MNSEKVKEIKKALECCKQNEIEETCRYCLVCPASIWDYEKTCTSDLFQKTLTLINELESENERLSKENFVLYRDRFTKKELDDISACRVTKATQQLKDRIAELEKENGELKEHVTEVEKGIINIAKERNKKDELASKFIDSYNDSIKQFAEKLKAKYGKSCSEYYPMLIEMTADDIDELLKEDEK